MLAGQFCIWNTLQRNARVHKFDLTLIYCVHLSKNFCHIFLKNIPAFVSQVEPGDFDRSRNGTELMGMRDQNAIEPAKNEKERIRSTINDMATLCKAGKENLHQKMVSKYDDKSDENKSVNVNIIEQ